MYTTNLYLYSWYVYTMISEKLEYPSKMYYRLNNFFLYFFAKKKQPFKTGLINNNNMCYVYI